MAGDFHCHEVTWETFEGEGMPKPNLKRLTLSAVLSPFNPHVLATSSLDTSSLHVIPSSGIGEASVYHALVVIFLEFFAWGLLTSPMITVLNDTFPDHTFLMNGLIVGIKEAEQGGKELD
ncbi:Hippocampus abundant transcript-like protein 2 [Chionoecetes opilio]|uniref:Hippocampus abundant transcript-like protein 2 n=1 Tax=Chionoecetes opilio TaxID=41210 RepID=A0A8J5CQR7_CHIOP|nr:Hippocampus abundant transcript-like protein 2 [Chionoecetes opilio]